MNCHNIGHPTAHIVRYLEVLLLSSSYVRMSKYFVHTQSLAGIVLLNLIFGSGGPPARKIKISNTNLFTFHSLFRSTLFAKPWSILWARAPQCWVGVQVRNMKMDFNTGCTWRCVGQWTLMRKICDFFIRLSRYQAINNNM